MISRPYLYIFLLLVSCIDDKKNTEKFVNGVRNLVVTENKKMPEVKKVKRVGYTKNNLPSPFGDKIKIAEQKKKEEMLKMERLAREARQKAQEDLRRKNQEMEKVRNRRNQLELEKEGQLKLKKKRLQQEQHELAKLSRKKRLSLSKRGPEPFREKESLELISLERMEVIGIMKKKAGYWALIKLEGDDNLYHVKESNYIGTNFGKISKIEIDGIIVKEQFFDQVFGSWYSVEKKIKVKDGSDNYSDF